MAGAIAHHFNNQLQAVMMNLQMAMGGIPRNADLAENLAEAMKSARKAAEVSSLMLTYLGQTHCKLEPLDLSDACQRGMPMLRAAVPQRMVLETDFIAPGPIVLANLNQMQQILNNLISNAWEAAGDRPGVIRLAVKPVAAADIPRVNRFPVDGEPSQENYACLEVADSGCGIEPQEIEKIFDPFYSKKFTGRGLGLPVVLGIVRAHHGVITVESKPEQGSVFRVYIPATTETLPAKAMPASQAPETERGGTVLVVDDEESLRKAVANAIRSLGFNVLSARDGVEAVEIFSRCPDPIRLVVCDLTMPRMDGWQTLAALRQLAPGIPVLLCSGYSEAQAMAGDHAERPQAFLSKPFEFEKLSDTVLEVLSPRR
jgi:CheY-like chemotaxis protein